MSGPFLPLSDIGQALGISYAYELVTLAENAHPADWGVRVSVSGMATKGKLDSEREPQDTPLVSGLGQAAGIYAFSPAALDSR